MISGYHTLGWDAHRAEKMSTKNENNCQWFTLHLTLFSMVDIIVNQAENDCVKYPSCIPCDITAPTSCEFCNTPYVYLGIQM